jgi:glycosyltransferase involved in cell wall biosynthesis
MKHIVCFHLLNDYSGSPMVLKNVLEGFLKRGLKVDLVSSHGGVLEEIKGYDNYHIHHYLYKFSPNNLVTMFRYAVVQLYTFLFAFRYAFTKNTFYINTILPVGPALAGRLMGKKVIYHYHENAFVKSRIYRMLAKAMRILSSKIICVSEYQRTMLDKEKNVVVIPNALNESFFTAVHPDAERTYSNQMVLMVSSLKLYKGIREFFTLAEHLPQFRFCMVVNDTEKHLDHFMKSEKLVKPDNLTLMPRQDDVAHIYNEASIVLNLTNKNYVIETFGLTAVEAMSAGLPVIVPTEGGIAEMVEDGVNGYKIDIQDLDKIEHCIKTMLTDKPLYTNLSTNAVTYAKNFDGAKTMDAIMSLL